MIKRYKELKVVTKEMGSLIDKKGYIPKSGGHVGKEFGTMEIVSYVKYQGTKMILSCSSCDKRCYISKVGDYKEPLLTDCQCHNEGIDKSVRSDFHNKKVIKGDNEYWCTGCESYREIHKRADRYCDVCNYINKNKITVYETFEEVMERWNPTTHKPCTMKLPYLSGTSTKGFKVRGFTYISVEDYEWCSKLHWIKANRYIKASCSKDNCKRVVEPIKDTYGKYIKLHRHVLGLSDANPLVGDHIRGLTLDNRRPNLRECTYTDNTFNSKKRTIGTSRYKGVDCVFSTTGKIWRTRLYIDGKYKTGSFHTEEEAALFYNELLTIHRHSDFNVYNKIY